ncbi:hypothetical protein WJD21_005329, partial [Klebsiella pneumoniae]
FIKQVHSNALTTILPETKGLFRNYHTAFRKQNNTETEVPKYTNTTICARHHSGKKWATSPKFSLAMLSGRDSSEAAT